MTDPGELVSTVEPYPDSGRPEVDGPEVERLARLYQVHPDNLAALLDGLRRLEATAQARHAPVLARARLHSGVLAAVCAHHGPVTGIRGVYCDGCDTEGEPPPDWPCSTWTLIEGMLAG